MKSSQRKLLVFTSLIGVLTVTSALLLSLAPAPLSPPETRPGPIRFERLLRVEWRKSIDTRAARWLLAAAPRSPAAIAGSAAVGGIAAAAAGYALGRNAYS